MSSKLKIDFFARREHFVDHLLPIWNELPDKNKGAFYIHISVAAYAKLLNLNFVPLWRENENELNEAYDFNKNMNVQVPGNNPIVTCAYGDLGCAHRSNPDRMFILAEHGVGLTPAGKKNGGYAGGIGLRRVVDMFLAPNEYIAKKTESVLDTMQVVVGTPKLDEWGKSVFLGGNLLPLNLRYSDFGFVKNNPVVCISFHWDGGHINPEAGNAWSIFGNPEVLKKLKKNFNLVAHCHPKARENLKPVFESLDIPFIDNFKDVMEQADIYINDCSSTLYEFLVTGKPVIIMNSPKFRKDVNFGIRFWDYTNIGYQVKNYSELEKAIRKTIEKPDYHLHQRKKAIADLYPNIGNSAKKAAGAILDFLWRTEKMESKLLKTEDYPKLVKLLSGANNSVKGIHDIEVEHLSWLGSQANPSHRIVEIGSHRGKSACCMASGVLHTYNRIKTGGENESSGIPTIHCIDLWQDGSNKTYAHQHSDETWNIFNQQIEYMGFQNIIKPHKQSSESAFKAYKKLHETGAATPIGLLFIDSNHHAPWVEADFQWAKYIPSGGYIALHDYGTRFPAVDHVVNDLLKPSGEWEDFTVVGRIFSARKK